MWSLGCVGEEERGTDPWTTALIEIVYLQLRSGAEPESEAGRGAVCLRAGRGNCICFPFCFCCRICFVFFSYYLWCSQRRDNDDELPASRPASREAAAPCLTCKRHRVPTTDWDALCSDVNRMTFCVRTVGAIRSLTVNSGCQSTNLSPVPSSRSHISCLALISEAKVQHKLKIDRNCCGSVDRSIARSVDRSIGRATALLWNFHMSAWFQ